MAKSETTTAQAQGGAKHTPGPWVRQGFRVYGPLDPRSKHGNGRSLIGGVVDDGIDWRCTPLEEGARGAFYAEAMANLALFAAAPEQNEALHVAALFVALHTGAGAREAFPAWALNPNGEPDAEVIHARCRAALAKAEGR